MKDRVIIELLMSILTGINILVLKQSKITTIKEDNEYTRSVRETLKMAGNYINDE